MPQHGKLLKEGCCLLILLSGLGQPNCFLIQGIEIKATDCKVANETEFFYCKRAAGHNEEGPARASLVGVQGRGGSY